MGPSERTEQGARRDLVVDAVWLAAAWCLTRAALFEAKDGYAARGTFELALRSGGRHLVEGLLWCALPALAASWGARRASRAGRIVVVLAVAAWTYAFVGFRLPHLPWYVPGTFGTTAKLVHVALVAFGLVLGAGLVCGCARGWKRGLAVGGALLLLASAGARVAIPRVGEARDERPDVLLVSLDTLRADRLSCYGYARPTSPALDRFAAEALVFEHAFTPQPWTLTAHATMLTGLTPAVHTMSETQALPASVPTLAEAFQDAGWTTAAVVDRVEWLQPMFGLDRGFDVYQNLPDDAALKVDRILTLLDDLGDARLFLFAHFYDAHSDWQVQPYDAAPEDVAQFTQPFDGPWEQPGEDVVRATNYLVGFRERGEVLPPDELAHVSDQYDAGIRTLDRELGRLFRELEARGRWANTIVLVTADHGEELFEHGQPLHLQHYDECVRVPFLLKVPGVDARALPGGGPVVGLVDVLPTLLELAGVEAPSSQGLSLAPLAREGTDAVEEERHVLLVSREQELGLRTVAWSVVPARDGLEWYELTSDPGEQRDLAGSSIAWADEATRRLAEERARNELLRKHFGGGASVELSDKERDALSALGYGLGADGEE